ncbi:MAG: phosphatidylglycerol lysyltransferase domain-containing protein [Oscillospiraceae bacterium]|nr:phosphatidylglycerol lysyltransferase domain-containing protein [Oscillospiraceae bacterium]
MLNFKKLTLEDIQKISPYFEYSENKTCDNTIGGTFMWRDFFSVEYAEFENTLIFKAKVIYRGGITAFTVPLGKNEKDILGCMEQLDKYCRSNEIPVTYCTATAGDMHYLNALYREIELFQEINWSDYLYRADDLKYLAGRKYSGQRNHINYFKKTYPDWAFEEITEDNIGEVKDFYNRFNLTANKDSEIFAEEQKKTLEVLDNYRIYKMPGGLLRIGRLVAAFAVGEIWRNVLFVHIEKADFGIRGAYQVINNEFVRHFASDDIEFINREEDVGDEGLRTSKKSYHPCEIIDKYIAAVK